MYTNSYDIETIERAITWDTAHLLKGNRTPASSSVSRFLYPPLYSSFTFEKWKMQPLVHCYISNTLCVWNFLRCPEDLMLSE